MYASDTSRNLRQSCLVFHSILDLFLKSSFWTNFYSSYNIILSYLVKHSIQMNMERRGGKSVGARQEKSPALTKITREMNQLTFQSKSWLNIFGKSSFLDLEPLTMIQTLCHFSPLMILRIWKYLSVFGFLWTSSLVNSKWYIKIECSDMT